MCDEVNGACQIPSRWREDMINCRNCKRNLVLFLARHYMKTMPRQLQPGIFSLFGRLLCDGYIKHTAWCITKDCIPQPNPAYSCNAEETDTRIWLHCKQSAHNKVLVLSPDTDVYHIVLPLSHGDKQIFIQINPHTSRDLCYLSLPSLITALQNDPDLSSIEPSLLPQILQTLYVRSYRL